MSALLWAPRAWIGGGWAERVLLRVGPDGRWAEVASGVAAPEGAEILPGPVLPALVDAHSHAFQRAFAGLAERRDSGHDDFWSWRDRMYRVALAISPPQLRAIAALLYRELLRGGYTQVCEFHYLQHQGDGRPYPDAAELGWVLADAAAEAGIGLTLLPVLYERAGFGQPALRADQRRFRADADAVHALARRYAAGGRPLLNAGVALHSLRAAAPASIHRLRALVQDDDGPIHIHVAEQTAEVADCLAATGRRPIEWLASEGLLDARWQLVHATHSVGSEVDAVAASGAGIVVCPSTEANLGDGLPDLRGWLAAGVPLAVGSDSQVGRDWREELRWLDYAQRLVLRQRNVAAAPAATLGPAGRPAQPATAARLFDAALAGGAAAAGHARWGLRAGARADLLLPDPADPASAGLPAAHTLDALVFSAPARPFMRTMVGGRWTVDDDAAIHARAAAALQALHGG